MTFNVGDTVVITGSKFPGNERWYGVKCTVTKPDVFVTNDRTSLVSNERADGYGPEVPFSWTTDHLALVCETDFPDLDFLRKAVDKARRLGYDVSCEASKSLTVTL